eukprot:SAG11_NODE_1529_length_4738_cov_1.628799_4_plen_91_part_00
MCVRSATLSYLVLLLPPLTLSGRSEVDSPKFLIKLHHSRRLPSTSTFQSLGRTTITVMKKVRLSSGDSGRFVSTTHPFTRLTQRGATEAV